MPVELTRTCHSFVVEFAMSLALLSIACLPGALTAVLELPVRIQNGYVSTPRERLRLAHGY